MKIYKEVKKITNKINQIYRLIELLEEKGFDYSEIVWGSAVLISGLQEKKGGLYKDGRKIASVSDDCYYFQQQGYCEDYYYGFLYYKTDVPGQFVRVNFNT